MASEISYSRGSLYNRYKESDPELAKKFLGKKYPDSFSLLLGSSFLITTIACGIIFTVILSIITNGFGPSPNPSFYAIVCPIFGGILILTTTIGLMLVATWYCKKRNILAEQLSVEIINGLAGHHLIDPVKGLSEL